MIKAIYGPDDNKSSNKKERLKDSFVDFLPAETPGVLKKF